MSYIDNTRNKAQAAGFVLTTALAIVAFTEPVSAREKPNTVIATIPGSSSISVALKADCIC